MSQTQTPGADASQRAVECLAPSGGLGEPGSSRPMSFTECRRRVSMHRSGGFSFSATISDRLGSWIAAAGLRVNAHPTYLTLCNLGLGLGGSAAVLIAGARHEGLAVAGVLLWQLAYVLDCADGQLARATGKASTYGASVDVLADMAVQASVVVALARIILATSGLPATVVVLFASLWFVNFVTFMVAKSNGPDGAARPGLVLSLGMLLRDYGFVILLLGCWLVVSRTTLAWPAMAVTASNVVVLVSRIVRDGALSLSGTPCPEGAAALTRAGGERGRAEPDTAPSTVSTR